MRVPEENERPERAPSKEKTSILTPEDIRRLESYDNGATGYFYRMLDDLENCIRTGVSQGRFTEEQAREDLQVALWYSFACNNVDEYEYYYKAAQWMPASEKNAGGCGVWYYRYACALVYCSRLEEALAYAERGVAEEPDYPWGWLQLGRLRSHFGDREGALEAVRRGLALVPGDHEFLTLEEDIRRGRDLAQMEFHWIDPDSDLALQREDSPEVADKRRAVACILRDEENLAAIKRLLCPTEWEADAPFCTLTIPYGAGTLLGRFCMNEAALSKLPLSWVRELVRRLPELERRGRVFLSAQADVDASGAELEWFSVGQERDLRLCYCRDRDHQLVAFDPDFSLSKADQPALSRAEGGTFLAFVLLEEPVWDADRFRRDLRDQWGIPCMTEEREDEEGGSTLVFGVDGMTAAVSLLPMPIPHGEAVERAKCNYLWGEAVEAAGAHRGHIVVTVLAEEEELRNAAILQVKLVCSACRQQGVLGIYANGTVYDPDFYLGYGGLLREDELPLPDLVWVGLYRDEEGLNAYTDGLSAFGKDEIEVLSSKAQPGELRSFLYDVADYVIEQDAVLFDGETIGTSEDEKLPITRSAGVWHEGMTLKIQYHGEHGAD